MEIFYQVGAFDLGSLIYYLQSPVVYSFLLPFLLIFAIVFGILTRTNLFGDDNKALNAIISISVAILALQFDLVPLFFSEIFPRFGIGLSVILVGLILLGLFLPSDKDNKYVGWLGLILALSVFLIVVSKSFAPFGWWSSVYNFYFYSPELITIILVILAIMAIVKSASPRKKFKVPNYGIPVYRS
jgi:hypothetical protein